MTAEIFDERDFEIFSLGMKYASDVAVKTGRGHTAMIAIRDEMAKQRQRFTSYLLKNEIPEKDVLRNLSVYANSKAYGGQLMISLSVVAFIFCMAWVYDGALKRVDQATKESAPTVVKAASDYYPPDFNDEIPPDWLHPERAQ